MRSERKYLLLLLLGTAFWGISLPLAKDGISIVSPFVFLMYRFVIAAIVLAVIFFDRLKNIDIRSFKYGVIMGIPLAIAISMQTSSLQYTSTSNAAFIAGMDVLLVPIFKLFLFKKRINTKVWIASIFAMLGLSIISVTSSLTLNFGDSLAFIAAISFAIYIIIVGKLSYKEYDIQGSVVVQMITCAIICGTVAFIENPVSELVLPNDASLWGAILFAGVLGSAFMYYIQNVAQKYVEDEKVAITYLFEPIFATVAAFLLFGEEITMRTVLGGGLIIFALFIAEYKFKRIQSLLNSQ